MKKILKLLFITVLMAVAAFLCLLFFLIVTEYKPEDEEELTVTGESAKTLKMGDSINILSFNIGYCGLGKTEDFFMDGGKNVRPDSADVIENNLNGVIDQIKEQDCDVVFMQEVDSDSKRSYHINEKDQIYDTLGGNMTYAYNFVCRYIPYPFPPLGKMKSGLLTINSYEVTQATRISLPIAFSWPVRLCQLKRCLNVQRTPIEGSDKEIVFVNLHLEAYDDGNGKIEQTRLLADFLNKEYEKGNYVIAGGDFNQTFSCVDQDKYSLQGTKHYKLAELPEEFFGEHWQMLMDDSNATCRSCVQPYDKNDKDHLKYVIDGFIVSDNLEVEELKTIDEEFEYSDHNPVRLTVRLSE